MKRPLLHHFCFLEHLAAVLQHGGQNWRLMAPSSRKVTLECESQAFKQHFKAVFSSFLAINEPNLQKKTRNGASVLSSDWRRHPELLRTVANYLQCVLERVCWGVCTGVCVLWCVCTGVCVFLGPA